MGELTATPKVKRGAVLVCRGGSGSRCAEATEKLGCHLKQADDGGGDRDAGVRQQGRSEGRSRGRSRGRGEGKWDRRAEKKYGPGAGRPHRELVSMPHHEVCN